MPTISLARSLQLHELQDRTTQNRKPKEKQNEHLTDYRYLCFSSRRPGSFEPRAHGPEIPSRTGILGAPGGEMSGQNHRSQEVLTMKTAVKPKPFAVIREFHLADWFTLANAVCGMGALFSMLTYLETNDVGHIYLAGAMLMAALLFDLLDGRVARWRKKTSLMGRELDSLADVISFGVAPAVIGYACGMQGMYDRIVLAFFVACGVSRLARFNITAEALSEGGDKVKYFEGTPIPTSLLLVILLVAAATRGALGQSLWFGKVLFLGFTLHPMVLLFALSGSLMVSRLRIPKW
jgi:CDP-diacylglycerol--serine O-phosphatidyltransferase